MKTILSLLLLSMCGCAVSQPSNDFTVSFAGNKTQLPITYRGGANPVVRVMVNGKGPFKFMFDTGSPDLLKLDERVFKMLQLPVIDSVLAGDGSGRNARSFPITNVSMVEVGEFKIHNTHAMVRNYNTRPGLDSIDGVIGPVFFSGYLVELNFENNALIISKGKLTAGENGVVAIRQRNGVPGMNVKIGGKEIDAHFDTGNMGSFTLPSSNINTADMLGEPRVIGRAQTVSNTFEIKEVQVKSTLYLGSIAFEKPVVVMNDVLPHANLGVRLLKEMNITLDMKNNLARLVKFEKKAATAGGNTLSEYAGNYEGGRTISVGEDGNLYVQRPGGMLLKMTRKSADTYTLEMAPGAEMVFERNAAGKVIALKVTRGDGNWETARKQ